MMNAPFVGKMSQSTTLLFTAPLKDHSYKNSFGGLIQRTIHRSLKLWRNVYSELLQKNTTNEFKFITLFIGYFIYSRKSNNKPIHLHDFVNAVQQETWLKTLSIVALGKQWWVEHYRKWFSVWLVCSVTPSKITIKLSINEFKKLRHKRWLIYKHLR